MALDQTQPREVTPQQLSRLKQWSQRKPCVSLMGEFSAGKSTLLNFLIEEDVLPTRATATELPPVWFSYGTEGSHWVDGEGIRHELNIADLGSVPMSARYVRIFMPAEILEHCDVVDTPGISDPNLAVESWRFAVGISNMVLWCTSATQAWRESERSAWLSLPERLQRHSLLIVTRADKLITEADRDKVARRLTRETTDLFNDRVFMSTPDALQAKAELSEGDSSPLWEASGAADLLDRLAERFEAIYEERATMFSRYEAEGAEGSVQPARPVRDTSPQQDPVAEEVNSAAAQEETPAKEPRAAAPTLAAVPDPEPEAQPAEESAAPMVEEPVAPKQVAADVEPVAGPVEVETENVSAAEPTEASEETVKDVAPAAEAAEELQAEAAEAEADISTGPLRVQPDETRKSSRPSAAEAGEAVEMFARLKDELGDDAPEKEPVEKAEPVVIEADADTVSALAELMANEASHAAEEPTEAETEAAGPSVDEEAEVDEPQAVATEAVVEETEDGADDVPGDAADIPREVLIWRDIVARTQVDAAHAPLVAMFDQFLLEAYGRPAHSQSEAAADKSNDTGNGSWRRLA